MPTIEILEDFIKTSENGILELSTPPGSAKSFSTQEVAKNLLSLELSQISHPIDHHPRFIFCVHVNTLMTNSIVYLYYRTRTKSRASASLGGQLSVFRTSKTQAASKDSLLMSALSLVKEDRVRVVPVP